MIFGISLIIAIVVAIVTLVMGWSTSTGVIIAGLIIFPMAFWFTKN